MTRRLSQVLRYGVLTFFALVLLAPLLYALYVSFEMPQDYGKWVAWTA